MSFVSAFVPFLVHSYHGLRKLNTRYSVHIVGVKSFKVLQTVFFYRAANAIFGRVGRIASEEEVIHLIVTKRLPVLLYGLEACPLRKTDLNSLDFVVNRFFLMKLFQTSNIDIVKCCQSHFCIDLSSVVHGIYYRP